MSLFPTSDIVQIVFSDREIQARQIREAIHPKEMNESNESTTCECFFVGQMHLTETSLDV